MAPDYHSSDRFCIEEVELSLKVYELFTELDGNLEVYICLFINSSMKTYKSNINEGIGFDESVWQRRN